MQVDGFLFSIKYYFKDYNHLLSSTSLASFYSLNFSMQIPKGEGYFLYVFDWFEGYTMGGSVKMFTEVY